MLCVLLILILNILLIDSHLIAPSNKHIGIIDNKSFKNKDKGDDGDKVPTKSIIDILSSNESFSNLILTLQKSDLIDYVNSLSNITFLAPVNDAFDKHDIQIGYKISKQQLKKFIIDDVILREYILGIAIEYTLADYGSPYIDDFQIPVLLDHRDGLYMVENANVLSDDEYISTSDSVVLAIDDLFMNPKESVCTYFQNSLDRNTGYERFRTFSDLIIGGNTCRSLQMSNLTFLTPSDSSLDINHIEKNYLLHDRGMEDKDLFLSNFILDGMVGGNYDNATVIYKNCNGDNISISSSCLGDEIIINNEVHSTKANYLLSDGIIHYFEDTLFNYKDTKKFPLFTPRKYLIGLEFEDFVDEVDFRGLSKLIDDRSLNQTIFVSNDYKSMTSLKNQMLYCFVNGSNEITSNAGDQEHNHKLLESRYCQTSEVDGDKRFCQKIKFEILEDGSMTLNGNSKIFNKEPYKIGNTSIYLIEEDLSLPPKLPVAISSKLVGFGMSIQFFKQFNYHKLLSNGNDFYTILLPSTKLWRSLDLTLDYLIDNPNLLKLIIEDLIIKGLIYDDFTGSAEFETYSDSKTFISRENSDALLIDNSTSVEISFTSQVLYSDGIIHPIQNNLPLPKDLTISTADLLTSQESLEFEKIINLVNLTHVLKPNSGYSILLPSSKSLLQENITASLGDIHYLEKCARLHILPPGSLDMILSCNSTSLTTLIPTMINGTHLTCRKLASGGTMLSITEGSGNEVRILRHGLVIEGSDEIKELSGIFLLDRPLNPNWLNNDHGKLYLHLPMFAIFVGILIGVVCVLLIFGCCLILVLGNTKIDQLEQQGSVREVEGAAQHIVSVNETMPLLSGDYNEGNIDGDAYGDGYKAMAVPKTNNSKKAGNVRTLGKYSSSFDARYSMNASASPIDMNNV